MLKTLTDEERNFLEYVGLHFESTGLPRMAGRVFAWLLIAEPSYQSPAEIAEALMASKGSISTTLKLLTQLGVIERHLIPGERHDHFRLREDTGKKMVQRGLDEEIRMFHELTDRALKLITDKNSQRWQWLEEMHARYSFLEKEFPVLMERYEKQRAEKITKKRKAD